MSILPSGYKRLLYIESTGTQWIDTGFVPVATSKVVAEVQYANVASAQYSGLYSGSYMMFGVASSKWEIYLGNKALATSTAAKASRTVVVLDAVNKRGEFNGVSTAAAYTSFGSASLTMPIFALREGINSFRNYSSMKLFSYKIYNANALVRNFIPCINDAGEIGLYETVNGVFCGNSGTGVFVAGPEWGYVELEYIESSGTQYINTEVIPDNNSRVEADFQFTASDTYQMLFGSRTSSSVADRFGLMLYGTNLTLRSDYAGNVLYFDSGIAGLSRHQADKNGNTCEIDGTTVTHAATSFSGAYPMFVFANNNGGVAADYAKAKIYLLKLYSNGTLIRDFIPAKLTDGSIGLIDKLTEEFYPNMGTGAFVAGPGKAGEYTLLEYIESTGSQYVDTNINAASGLEMYADFEFSDIPDNDSIAGANSNGTRIFLAQNINGVWGYGYGSYYGGSTGAVVGEKYRIHSKLFPGSQTLEINGATVASGTVANSYDTGLNLYLLGMNLNGAIFGEIKGKLYSCQIYDNGTLVRDYVPIRTEHGIVVLYDALNGVVYENVGTGQFIAGPDAITVPAVPADLSVFTDSIVPSISTEYSVSAFNEFGESDKATITIAPSAAPPAPSKLRVMFADFSSAQIAWNASVGASEYRVYRDGKFIHSTEGLTFTDDGLSEEQEYIYAVSAVNEVGESVASELTVRTTDFALITDRTAADVAYVAELAAKVQSMSEEEMSLWLSGLKGAYNATDLNRVEKAVAYVSDRLETAGWYVSPNVRLDWSYTDFPTAAEMDRYLANIRLLRSTLTVGMPSVPADMDRLTFTEANIIERILLMLDAAVTNIMANVYYSSEIYSGEV